MAKETVRSVDGDVITAVRIDRFVCALELREIETARYRGGVRVHRHVHGGRAVVAEHKLQSIAGDARIRFAVRTCYVRNDT